MEVSNDMTECISHLITDAYKHELVNTSTNLRWDNDNLSRRYNPAGCIYCISLLFAIHAIIHAHDTIIK